MNRDVLSVSALTEAIRELLEESFDFVWVEGEVSNLRQPSSGHIYFTLKDDKSQIRAVIFRSPLYASRLRRPAFDPEEGMKVLCRGRVTVYQPRGEYQLIVDAIEPQGVGALQIAFEKLKARLEAEGLFAASRKRPIPFLPKKIAVITSPTGSVIRDILNVTGRRFPSIPLLIAPVRVQGAEAPEEITAALKDVNTLDGIEVIIIARGGGSLEDLMPFNDERVARAVYHSRIPVISAVGHETDFTIADFVADLRAPTPSAAAELALPVKSELADILETLRQRMVVQQVRTTQNLRDRMFELRKRLKTPDRIIADLRLTVDDRMERAKNAFSHKLEMVKQRELKIASNLKHLNPRGQIREWRFILEQTAKNMLASWGSAQQHRRDKMTNQVAVMNSLNPLAVLSRGYGIARLHPEGTIIRSSREVAPGRKVSIIVAQGSFQAQVTKTDEE